MMALRAAWFTWRLHRFEVVVATVLMLAVAATGCLPTQST